MFLQIGKIRDLGTGKYKFDQGFRMIPLSTIGSEIPLPRSCTEDPYRKEATPKLSKAELDIVCIFPESIVKRIVDPHDLA